MGAGQAYSILEYFAYYSALIPIIPALFRLKSLNKTLIVLLLFSLLGFLADKAYSIALPDTELSNRIINSWSLIEFSLLCLLFILEARTRKLTVSLYLLLTLFAGFSVFALYSRFGKPDTIVAPTEAGLAILLSVFFLVRLFYDPANAQPLRHYFFWICSGLLLYFSASILIFLAIDYLDYSSYYNPSEGQRVWSIHNIAVILCNLVFSVGVWQSKHSLARS